MPDDHTKHKRAWLLPATQKSEFRKGLYIVSTPIGNLGDITIRALDTLQVADTVICEDTRITGKLLNYYGLKKKLIPYNDHNAQRQKAPILTKLQNNEMLVLVSDAGTPLISDPGYKLVQACLENKIFVTAVPGPNAPLTALQLSGLPTDKFCFLGFLPATATGRTKILQEWSSCQAPLIFFETARRLPKALHDIHTTLGNRRICIARELTKLYEEVCTSSVSDIIKSYEQDGYPKGELVLIIGTAESEDISEHTLKDLLKTALMTMRTKDAAESVASATGYSRKKLYTLALELEKNTDGE